MAKKKDIPFFLNANMCDPHRPWAGQEGESWMQREIIKAEQKGLDINIPGPNTDFKPEEIPVPDFLIDTPAVRRAIAAYYNSVNRMDECVGAILTALDEAGLTKNTIVVFLADQGMGAAFAKRSVYMYGIRTPMIIKWPGKIKPGEAVDDYVVSSADIMPTLIEMVPVPTLKRLTGYSLWPLIKGEKPKEWRETTYAAFNCMNGEEQYWPSRSMTGKRYFYLWNGWVNGKNKAKTVLHSHLNMDEMFSRRWGTDWEYGIPEEFYDIETDPGYWNNLIDSPGHQELIEKFRQDLLREMERTGDPELENFREYLHQQTKYCPFSCGLE
jgi:N-sulfoglucosamine sulfohydrolase